MTAKLPALVPNLTQFAVRFAVVSDTPKKSQPIKLMPFQSALRFAVVSDLCPRSAGWTVPPSFNPL